MSNFKKKKKICVECSQSVKIFDINISNASFFIIFHISIQLLTDFRMFSTSVFHHVSFMYETELASYETCDIYVRIVNFNTK